MSTLDPDSPRLSEQPGSNGVGSLVEATLGRMEDCLEEMRCESAQLSVLLSLPPQLTAMQDMLRYLIDTSVQLQTEVQSLKGNTASAEKPSPSPPTLRRRTNMLVRQTPALSALVQSHASRGVRPPRRSQATFDSKKFVSSQSAVSHQSQDESEAGKQPYESSASSEAPDSPAEAAVRRSSGCQPSQITMEEPPDNLDQSSTQQGDASESKQNVALPLALPKSASAGAGRLELALEAAAGEAKKSSTGNAGNVSPQLRAGIPRRTSSDAVNEDAEKENGSAAKSAVSKPALRNSGSTVSFHLPNGEAKDEKSISKSSERHKSHSKANAKEHNAYSYNPYDMTLGDSEHRDSHMAFISPERSAQSDCVSVDSQLSLGVVNRYSAASSQFAFTGSMEAQVKHQLARWTLRPNSHLRLFWDVIIILHSVCIGMVIPLGLVYFDNFMLNGTNAVVLYAADLLWPLDIILNFRTGFFSRGELQMNPVLIVLHYVRRWFVFDLLAALPLALTQMDATWHTVACTLKLLRLLQIIPRFAQLQAEYRYIGILPTKILVVYMLLSHLTACGWRLVQDDERSEESAAPWWDLYVADLYWTFMTLTTIGYGDIVPNNAIARLYAIVGMFVGSASFGALVSACAHITNMVFNDEVESQVVDVMRFMARRGVPMELQRRVQRNLRHHLHSQRLTSLDPELLALMSPTIQRELSLSMLGSTVLRFPLFKNTQRSFLAELAQVHCWVQCMAGDIVLEEGEILQNLIFVIRGRLQSRSSPGADLKRLDVSISEALKLNLDPDDEAFVQAETAHTAQESCKSKAESVGTMESAMDSIVTACFQRPPEVEHERKLLSGAWFGEACLLDQERICAYSVVAVTDAELAVLAADDYLRVVRKYPKLWDKHQEIERGLAKGTLSIDKLAYRPPKQHTKDFKIKRGALLARMFNCPNIGNLTAVAPL